MNRHPPGAGGRSARPLGGRAREGNPSEVRDDHVAADPRRRGVFEALSDGDLKGMGTVG